MTNRPYKFVLLIFEIEMHGVICRKLVNPTDFYRELCLLSY